MTSRVGGISDIGWVHQGVLCCIALCEARNTFTKVELELSFKQRTQVSSVSSVYIMLKDVVAGFNTMLTHGYRK